VHSELIFVVENLQRRVVPSSAATSLADAGQPGLSSLFLSFVFYLTHY
jgi:hypothetical protein